MSSCCLHRGVHSGPALSLKWLLILIAPALLALACGGDGSTPTPSPTPSPAVILLSPTPEPTPTVTPTPTSQPKGRIAFVSDRDGNREVYIMNADGSDQTYAYACRL